MRGKDRRTLLYQPKWLDLIHGNENATVSLRLFLILGHLSLEKSGNNAQKVFDSSDWQGIKNNRQQPLCIYQKSV